MIRDETGGRRDVRVMGKHSRKRRGSGAWAILLLVCAALACGLLLRGRTAPAPSEETETAPPAPTPTPTEAVPETPAPTPTPWNLVLVNRANPVPEDWTVDPVTLANGQIVDSRIYEPLMEMFEAAREINQGILPNVESGYRTVEKQRELYEQKRTELLRQGWSEAGAKAETEKWVTVPGTSEHQLGIAVDISGAVYAIYPWLQENSWKYGFIMRYPPDKTAITGISGEEWHYRYVGREAAAEMHETGLCLEEYLEALD